MSSSAGAPRRELPPNPDLRHLKEQAKDLVRSGDAATLAQAQFRIAREYGFASWPNSRRTSNRCARWAS